MKKTDKLHIPISSEEKQKLKSRAEDCGLSLSSYCLFVLLKTIPKIEDIPD